MPKITLTDRFCSTAKPPNGRTDYFDAVARGLALRVTENGHRSWCFHYRSPRDGKRARATIGTYPATSLAAARGMALEAKAQVEAGHDPRRAGDPASSTAVMTVIDLVGAYMADPNRAGLRSRHAIERRLRKNVVPIIGAVKLDELRRRDVRNVADKIMQRGSKIEANRTFCDVRSMIRWALEREYLNANPIDGMAKPAEEVARDRVLSDDEIRALGRGCRRRCRGRYLASALSSCASLQPSASVRSQVSCRRPSSTSAPANGAFPVRGSRMRMLMSCRYPIWRFASWKRRWRMLATDRCFRWYHLSRWRKLFFEQTRPAVSVSLVGLHMT
jgi:hypothetical protein